MTMSAVQLEMNFEDAFRQFAVDPSKPSLDAPEPVAEAAPETTEPATESVTEAAPETTEPAAETEAAAPPEEEAPPTPSAAPKGEDDEALLRRLSQLVKDVPEKPAAPEKPAPAPAAEAEAPAEILSAEEKEFLSNYEKDWPDVAKAEQLRRRAEYQQLVGYVFAEVAKEMRPLMEVVRTLSERTHLSDLHSVAPDYDDVRDKVIDWVGKQPPYLQSAYQHVIDQGTPEEVADLIRRYKQETAPAQPAPAPRRSDTELPTATKQAAQSLAPVSSKRSAITQAQDPNDFEAAFAQFASKLETR